MTRKIVDHVLSAIGAIVGAIGGIFLFWLLFVHTDVFVLVLLVSSFACVFGWFGYLVVCGAIKRMRRNGNG